MSGGFADLGLLPEILQAIDDQRWVLPSDIQDEAIPLILGGGDVMGAAETGSGKTAAFALPILQSVYERLKSFEDTSSKTGTTEAVVQLNDLDRDTEMSLLSPYSAANSNPDKWLGIRASYGVKYGKVYFECYVKGTGNCRVGWSTRLASLDLGKDKMGYGYGAKGFKSTEGAFDKYGEQYTNGDVIGCLLDLDGKNVQFSKNGKMFDVAYPIHTDVHGAVFFPTITLSGSAVEVNFGQQPVRYCPPGFTVLGNVPSGNLFSAESSDAYSIAGKRTPLAIVIEPTRDLAEQVYQTFLDLSKYINAPKLRTALLIGDDGRVNVKKMLQEGVDIVVGTIGKLTGALQSKQLDLSQIRFFVLDEADRLTSADNLSSVKQIFAHCPQSGTGVHRLQVCFFSATLHDPAIRELADAICFNPIWVDLKGQETAMPDTLHHVIYKLSTSDASYGRWVTGQKPVTDQVHADGDFARECPDSMQNVHSQRVKEIKPFVVKSIIDKFKMLQAMIFCRTNLDCTNLERFFQSQSKDKLLPDKYTCAVLGGMMSMEDRRRNLQRFKDGEIKFLICTDVAARGIDVDSLPYVINVTLPDMPDDYVHRVGRAGRADRMGLAISIVATDDREKVWYHKCNRKDRGASCFNRKLVDAGGCTMWYDENLLLAKVEKKINKRIPVMEGDSLELPTEIKALNVRYGESAAESVLLGDNAVYMTEKMIGKVRTLAELEMEAQNIFLCLSQNVIMK